MTTRPTAPDSDAPQPPISAVCRSLHTKCQSFDRCTRGCARPGPSGMPMLPALDAGRSLNYSEIRYVTGWPDSYVRSYAIDYARSALSASPVVPAQQPNITTNTEN